MIESFYNKIMQNIKEIILELEGNTAISKLVNLLRFNKSTRLIVFHEDSNYIKNTNIKKGIQY